MLHNLPILQVMVSYNYSTKLTNEITSVFLEADNNGEPKMTQKEF